MAKELSRRDFLRLSVVLPITLAAKQYLPPAKETEQEPPFPFMDILRLVPEINPSITAVNLPCIPNKIENQFSHLHHPKESLIMAVPYSEIETGEISVHGYGRGLKEAISRKQKVSLVIEIPAGPIDQGVQSWFDNLPQIIKYFRGAFSFIIGNEINDPNCPWNRDLEKYIALFSHAYQTIKTLSPESSVFPWQQAYFGQGELLTEFIGKTGGKIDGLAINYYDNRRKMESWIKIHREILHESNLNQLPICLTELGKPLNTMITSEEQARLVVQNLTTAAYLQKQGLIDFAAWFCAYSSVFGSEEHRLSTSNQFGFTVNEGLFAYILCSHLLAGEDIQLKKDESGLVKIVVFGSSQPKAAFFWNEGEEEISIYLPKAQRIFTADGKKLPPDKEIILFPSNRPETCAGDTIAAIL